MSVEPDVKPILIKQCTGLLLRSELFACEVGKAYVLSLLWAWHVVPHFAVPALNTWSMFALLLVRKLFAQQWSYSAWRLREKNIDQKIDFYTDQFVDVVWLTGVCWLLGYLVHVAT